MNNKIRKKIQIRYFLNKLYLKPGFKRIKMLDNNKISLILTKNFKIQN